MCATERSDSGGEAHRHALPDAPSNLELNILSWIVFNRESGWVASALGHRGALLATVGKGVMTISGCAEWVPLAEQVSRSGNGVVTRAEVVAKASESVCDQSLGRA